MAINVIKEGNEKFKNKTRYFECSVCGCEFTADAEEYSTEWDGRNEFVYHCECPTCSREAYYSKPYDEGGNLND